MPAVLLSEDITALNKLMGLKTFRIPNSVIWLSILKYEAMSTLLWISKYYWIQYNWIIIIIIQAHLNGVTWILEEVSLW